MIRTRDFSYTNKKGPRYLKQKNSYSCAVIAILNLLKNLGYKYTYRDYQRFKKWLGCNSGGTPHAFIRSGLRAIENDFQEIKSIRHSTPLTLKTIDKSLKRNSVVLVNFHYTVKKRKATHIFLLTRATKKMYECINVDDNQTITLINRKELNKMLREKRDGWPSCGWVIKKEEI